MFLDQCNFDVLKVWTVIAINIWVFISTVQISSSLTTYTKSMSFTILLLIFFEIFAKPDIKLVHISNFPFSQSDFIKTIVIIITV